MSAEIRSIIADGRLVSAAKVAVLNLEALKTFLGPKWGKLESLVCAFFEASIKQSLKPGDAFLKAGELGYILVYRDLSLEEAQRKCAALSRDVCRRLFGEEGIELAVRNVVGHVDSGLLKTYQNVTQNMTAAIDQSLEQHGKETLIFADRGEQPSQFRAEQLSQFRSEQSPHLRSEQLTQFRGEQQPTQHRGEQLPQVRSEQRPQFDTAASLKLKFTQHQDRSFACSESQLSFAYRPIWDCQSRMILTYLCQPIPAEGVDTPLLNTSGFCSVSTGDADCALLDRIILAHCATRIDALRQSRVQLLLGVPVHFSTLSRPRAWKIFNDVYSQVPAALLRELVLVIFGLEGVPNVRVVQETSKLTAVRHLFCVTEPDNAVAARFAYVKAHAVGVELPRTRGRERHVLESVKSVAADARKNGHESFALGVTNTSRAVNAMAAGVRYLEGPAIHPVVADPRCAFIHELEDLYVSKTG